MNKQNKIQEALALKSQSGDQNATLELLKTYEGMLKNILLLLIDVKVPSSGPALKMCLLFGKDNVSAGASFIQSICRTMEAEDVEQELTTIFLELLPKWKSKSNVPLSAYIAIMMKWKVVAWLQKYEVDVLNKPFCVYTGEDTWLYNYDVRIEEAKMYNNMYYVNKAIDLIPRLNERYKKILRMKALGYSQKEIGKETGVIHTHVACVLQIIKKRIKGTKYEDEIREILK